MEWIETQFIELQKQYPELSMFKTEDGKYKVSGKIMMCATDGDSEPLFDDYEIEMYIPEGFPKNLPVVFETSGAVPQDFEHFMSDGSLCLGVENEIRKGLIKTSTILEYFNKYVINYLYAVSSLKRFGSIPFKLRSHGVAGIAEFYMEEFKVSTIEDALNLLYLVVYEGKYRGHNSCPCGSGDKLRNCHGDLVLQAINSDRRQIYQYDFCLLYEKVKRKQNGKKSTASSRL